MNDGFDICTLESLDKSDDVSFTPTKLIDNEDDNSFVLTSLVRNKIVLDEDVTRKLDGANEGSSPTLLSPSRTLSLVSKPKSLVPFRRWNSVIEKPNVSPGSKIDNFTSPATKLCFKRPVDCGGLESGCKRPRKSLDEHFLTTASAEAIDAWLPSVSDNQNLTADGKRKLLLPTISGTASNADLNNVDSAVVADLINGKFSDQVDSFRIIDARYEYEFKGGHIVGAENFGRWDEEEFVKEFLPEDFGPKSRSSTDKENDDPASMSPKRKILLFHCEFSSARGPALLRFLRSMDRSLNKDNYPALYYPECYLLHQGYKEFFNRYPELCVPQNYVRMADPKFVNLERVFHKRSKTWASGGLGTVARTKMMMKRGMSYEDTDLRRKNLFR